MSAAMMLAIAIISEIAATASLKASAGFTRLIPSLIVVIGYGSAFYFLSHALKSIPLGLAYAIWSGVGTIGAVAIGYLVWQERLTLPGAIGVFLIIIGVILVNLFSVAPNA